MQDGNYDPFQRLPISLPECIASVTIPARNEAATIERALTALAKQSNLDNTPMNLTRYEVVLLLNNCTDDTAKVIERFRRSSRSLTLHIASCHFRGRSAHVGNARSLLMNQACLRLEQRSGRGTRLLLTTDADTCVDKHWIAENLRAVEAGAEAVGGNIVTHARDRRHLPPHVRRAYALDRRYQQAAARLSHLLDPDEHDPWPRHHHHFGASLACTAEAFRRCGGMQPVSPLEDLAFYRSLLYSGVRFRHEPRVRVFTSTRTQGRAPVGLSCQLRQWERGIASPVPSAQALEKRFRARAILRTLMSAQLCRSISEHDLRTLCSILQARRSFVRAVLHGALNMEQAWLRLQGDIRVHESLPSDQREGTLHDELHALYRLTQSTGRSCAIHPCDMSHAA